MMALKINGDAEFWHARSELTYIHDYARACQVSPWALLSVVLARVCAAVPPHVATQPLYGNAPGTLNLFVAVLGGSGDGKGLTERMARALLPDIRNATTALPVSGEGIPALFATRETQGEDGRKPSSGVSIRELCSPCRKSPRWEVPPNDLAPRSSPR